MLWTEKKLTLQEVQKVINKSYKYISKENRLVSIPWVMCNNDSLFYKADTIRLYKNTSNYFQREDCCFWAYWSFLSNKTFTEDISYTSCADTSQSKVAKLALRKTLTMRVEDNGNYVNIETYNNDKLQNIFQVVAIDKVPTGDENQLTERITLKRIR